MLISYFLPFRQKHTVIQVCILIGLCTMCSIAVYATWTAIYKKQLNIPPKLNGRVQYNI